MPASQSARLHHHTQNPDLSESGFLFLVVALGADVLYWHQARSLCRPMLDDGWTGLRACLAYTASL